ncbi:MAG: ABC transporter substrate-binding protein [Mycobacteriales bacterium]
MRSRFGRPLCAVLAAATLAVAGCSAGSRATSGATSGGAGNATGSGATQGGTSGGQPQSLSIGFVAEPASLDFSKNDGAAIPQVLLYNVYEGLVKLDSGGDIKPLLAKSWTISKDRKTYMFTLQPNATFSSGAKFTAADAVFSINRVKTAWTISLKSGMDVVKDAKALSATKLQVDLKAPSNSWLYAMTSRIGAMFSRTGVANLATKPVGTGPYTLQRWNRGDSIILQRNAQYWGQQPAVQTVTFKYFNDPTAMNNALLTGGINVVSTVQAPQSLAQFKNNSKYQIIDGTSTGEVVLSFNNSRPPLTDKRVRQAINYAIDKKALIKTAWAGYGTPIGSMVPPTDPWYQNLNGLYPYSQDKARKLLARSGHSKLTLRLRIPNLPYAVASAQVVKSDLAQVGITANIDTLEFPARWLDVVFTKADYDMSIINHVEPRDLPALFGNPKYYLRYDNPAVQKLITAADEGTVRNQITDMQKAARTIATDAGADFLFLFPNLEVADTDVHGLPKNAVTESFDVTGLSRG